MTSSTVAGIDLMELVERVEVASGPDRELDAAIFSALKCGTRDWMHQSPEAERVWARNYTASLDAAMTLVGGDAFWRLGNDGEGPDVSAFKATVTSGDGLSLAFHDAVAATPALALVAAALRARSSLIEEERS